MKEGLVKDIFKAERAYELVKAIGLKSEEMKIGTLKEYDELFGTFQYALQAETLLAVAKIYDPPSKKYPTRCLRGVLEFLSEHTGELPEIREPEQLRKHLNILKVPVAIINDTFVDSGDFAKSFSTYIENQLSEPPILDAIQKLKRIRDKSICHNEKRDLAILGPTWKSLKDLIEISKNVVGVLGWAYFSTAYVINGEYILTNDACKTSFVMNDLFDFISNNS